jgi:imidazolonepropionase-like amidohydrolase
MPIPRRLLPAALALVAIAAYGERGAVNLVARAADAGARPPEHGQRVRRLLIRNAMVIYGNAKPAFGPVDILVEDGLIARIGPAAGQTPADAVIEASGKYVMPGMVNTHVHWQDQRAGIPQPIQYERNLYLASGVTTTRELGNEDFDKSKRWQAESAAATVPAPRMQVYWRVEHRRTPEAMRVQIREAKQRGADGLKIFGMDRDLLEAVMDEARQQELQTTTHIGVEEVTARDLVELGVGSIEHFYGVADAALDGIQDFPPEMNYSNEVHRFGRAGELYAQANPDKLRAVIDLMVERHVAWSPTLSIYEAARDLIRAQNVPWFADYLHPATEAFFRPSIKNHGSFFLGWTNTQEVRWKRQYRLWMDALREFGVKGGIITAGDDAAYIYSLYGFGFVRELELHEEAGFHPLEVLRHATWNGARLLGLGDRLGKVREGFLADLLVVNGNPLQDLRLLGPTGTDLVVAGQVTRAGGIEWTLKDGIPYHGPTMLREVRDMVARARADRARATTAGQ